MKSNAIEKGKNYGFPVIGYGREYTGKPINGDKTAQDGMEQPVYFWTPGRRPGRHRVLYRVSCSRRGRAICSWRSSRASALVRLVLKEDRVDRRGTAAD